jgi:modulator of FtsH protease HflC
MTSLRSLLIGLAALVAVVTLIDGVLVIRETEQVIITQFGKPVGAPRIKPGLSFKIPVIQKSSYFDKRYLEWDGDANQIPTKDKKFIFVDTYARWEITDPLQFFVRLRDERGAQSRLDDILDGETRNAVASHDLLELVRSTNREPELTEEYLEDLEVLERINVGREAIEKRVLERANQRTGDLGIRILDFRFKRMNYVDEVRQRVYERMVSERNQIAELFRSEGQGESRVIQGDKDRELAAIQSEAQRQAEEIRGRADAQATAIYAAAYNRSPQTRELYGFLKSLETLQRSLDSTSTVVLSTDSEIFKYLRRP